MIDPQGRIVLGGNFPGYVMRDLPDGSLDPSFPRRTGFNDIVYALTRDGSGRILASGSFTSYDGLLARGYWEF